jgi:lysophospholipase L1-like esterase
MLIISEIILRLVSSNQFYIWTPNLKQYFLPDSTIFTGINDTSFFKINPLGLRGDEKRNDELLNIVTIGGSTTECLYLDQTETWSALLEKDINTNGNTKVQVFNGGKSGINSNHHLLQIQKLLENYNWIDIIIVLQGINDLQYALSSGNNYKTENSQSVYNKSFLVSPVSNNLPWYKSSYLYMYISRLKKTMESYKLAQDPYGKDYIKWRNNRTNASVIIDSLPNLEQSLSDYKKINEAIIELVKSKNKRIIFLTQPVAWDYNMSVTQKNLCWFGWIGNNQDENEGKYYSFPALKKSLDKYNSLLIELCKEKNIECIDLENLLEKDTTTFYDDCHFNESGAIKLSKIIATFLDSKL